MCHLKIPQGEELSGKSPVAIPYVKHLRAPIPKKCRSTVYYSSADSPPKRPDDTVHKLCKVECDFDTGFDQWTPVGDPDEGYRRCDDVQLTMTFTGEPKWEFRVGSQEATTTSAIIEYMDQE